MFLVCVCLFVKDSLMPLVFKREHSAFKEFLVVLLVHLALVSNLIAGHMCPTNRGDKRKENKNTINLI